MTVAGAPAASRVVAGDEPVRPCPACGERAPSAERVVDGKRDIAGGPLRLVTCGACDAVYQPVVPSTEALARWYDYMSHIAENFALTPLLQRRQGRVLDAVAPYRETGRLLDVGAGGGMFVRAAMARGWEAWGTEISPSLAALLREDLGARLYEGALVDAPFPKGGFDVVFLVEVIEHLGDPVAYLRAARELLRPGGCIYLTTPHLRGLSGRLLGDGWMAVGEEHLAYFDRRSLGRLLERAGFDHARITTSSIDTRTPAGWLHRLLPRAASAAAPTIESVRSDGSTRAPEVSVSHGRSFAAPAPAAAARAFAVDHAMQAVNRALDLVHLGDTLKVLAERPRNSARNLGGNA